MDQNLADGLALVDRHIAVTAARIARQAELIGSLAHSGQSPASAERLLTMLKQSLAGTQRYRKLLMADPVAYLARGDCDERMPPPETGNKSRFSEFMGEASYNQEETGCLEQGLDDEAEAIVAERQAPVLEDPGVATLDRPVLFAQA